MSKKEFSVRPFYKLNKKIEHRPVQPSPLKKVHKKKEQYTDEELFGREMNGVAVNEAFRALACFQKPRRPGKEGRATQLDDTALVHLKEITAGSAPIHLPDTQEYVEWVNPREHDIILPRLHQGDYSVQAFLDLHGFTVPEAEEELDLFLAESKQKGLRCVKIIHGRGLRSVKGGRLKDVVVKRLTGRYRKDLIAFATARQCDGGLGALYVLLKK